MKDDEDWPVIGGLMQVRLRSEANRKIGGSRTTVETRRGTGWGLDVMERTWATRELKESYNCSQNLPTGSGVNNKAGSAGRRDRRMLRKARRPRIRSIM